MKIIISSPSRKACCKDMFLCVFHDFSVLHECFPFFLEFEILTVGFKMLVGLILNLGFLWTVFTTIL